MTELKSTGEICEYADFRQEAIKPRRTQKAQRQEIRSCLDKLTEQGDFWSLEVIRQIVVRLVDEKESAWPLYYNLRQVLRAKKSGEHYKEFFVVVTE